MRFQRPTSTIRGHQKGADSLLRRFFDACKRLFETGGNNQSRPKAKSQLSNAEYHLTAKEMDKIIDAALSPRDRAILRLLAETGLRRCEIVGIHQTDIRWIERQLIVTEGKGNKTRLVPLTKALTDELRNLAARIGGDYLFCSYQERPLSIRQLNRIVAEAGTRAKVSNPNPQYRHITPHLFRHSFARLWKDRGGSIEALSKIMGHQSVRTTWDLYGTMSLNDIQREYCSVMTAKCHEAIDAMDKSNCPDRSML